MQEEEFIDIANKVADGSATDQQKQLYLCHLASFAKENPEWEKLNTDFRQQIEDMVRDKIRTHVLPETIRKSTLIKLWQRIAGVAAAIALIVLSVYFFNNGNNAINNDPQIVNQDVAPGSFGATLTLANGKTIKLSDASNGKLAQEAGIAIAKSADGQLEYEIKGSADDPNKINTLSTGKGETYKVRLPDGSLVYLNAASSLTYPVSLIEHGKRKVKLRGEGYFEISKDKEHPFVVQTDNQEVEVLGTHFNINAYGDEPAVRTTLLEGRIRVNKSTILFPGEQATLINGNLKVSKANLDETVAWKEGSFQFNEEKMASIVRKLERWYDVEIELSDKLANKEFSGNISRSRSISRVLRMMEKTNGIQFKIEGRRITAIEK
ncbi:FecR family protein [Sphingobacterium nematocida]|uniref:FecR family protein n=1 Tax=Sphingobacterium nematocida TaxID=1513896 RepID=A0A1T5FIB6_9SPHI|nr:FecR domain-containing protein [Sphingobacterium nematocida]SKB95923.1 FecR family protein [Sphingobacterium nematocida]